MTFPHQSSMPLYRSRRNCTGRYGNNIFLPFWPTRISGGCTLCLRLQHEHDSSLSQMSNAQAPAYNESRNLSHRLVGHGLPGRVEVHGLSGFARAGCMRILTDLTSTALCRLILSLIEADPNAARRRQQPLAYHRDEGKRSQFKSGRRSEGSSSADEAKERAPQLPRDIASERVRRLWLVQRQV